MEKLDLCVARVEETPLPPASDDALRLCQGFPFPFPRPDGALFINVIADLLLSNNAGVLLAEGGIDTAVAVDGLPPTLALLTDCERSVLAPVAVDIVEGMPIMELFLHPTFCWCCCCCCCCCTVPIPETPNPLCANAKFRSATSSP